MSYDFSFEKGQMWLLGALAALMSVLLVAAGFLLGRITLAPSATTTATTATPAITATPVLPSPAVSTPLGSVQAAVPVAPIVLSTPAAAVPTAETSTVDISSNATNAAAAPEVYQLTASGYALQYGAFRESSNARDLLKQLKDQKVIASVVTMQNAYGESFAVVRSSAYPTVAEARQAAVDQANRLGMPIVVRPAGRL